MENNNNLFRYNGYVTRTHRNRLNNHRSGLVWLTGLPGSGKSTLAHRAEKELCQRGIRAYVLDGDNVRCGLNADLGFSREDRQENIRRILEVSKLLVDAGLIVLCAFISPYAQDRAYARQQFAGDTFLEVYVKCSLEECQRRDPKGQYQKARAGIIAGYTGISAPYQEPSAPELIIDTETMDLAASGQCLLRLLEQSGLLGREL